MRQLIVGLLALVLWASPGFAAAQSTEERLAKLEAEFKELQQTSSYNNQRFAEALAIFEQIRQEMAELKGEFEKVRYALTQGSEGHQKNMLEFDHRLSRVEERVGTIADGLQEVAALQPGGETLQGKKAQEALYQEAFSELTRRNYQVALGKFTEFVKKYPKSTLADNGQYWAGECYFAMGDFQKAILEFQKVVSNYAHGNKLPAAMLKQGISFMELKSYADAKIFLETVVQKHPHSPEALQARERLMSVEELLKETR